MKKSIVPQISASTKKAIEDTAETAGGSFKVISTSNLILGIVFGGVLQTLWGTIREIKTIVLLILIAVPFPAFANTFFVACMQIADIDIFSGKPFYEAHFVFKATEPLSDIFKNAGFGDQNYLLNSGSVTIMVVVIMVYHLFKWIVSKLFVRLLYKCKKNETILKIGIWGFDEQFLQTYNYANLKLFLESYLDIVICVSLNMNALTTNNYSEFGLFWSTFDDVFCSLITIISFFCLLVFPIYGIIKIH